MAPLCVDHVPARYHLNLTSESRFEGADTNHNMKKTKSKADVFGFCYSALINTCITKIIKSFLLLMLLLV